MTTKPTSSRLTHLKTFVEFFAISILLVFLIPILVILIAIALFRLRKARLSSFPSAIRILGVQIWNTTIDEAVSHITAVIQGQGLSKPVFFVNAACFNIAADDPDYQEILAGPGTILADGIGVRLAGLLTNQPVLENTNGTDLFPRLCQAIDTARAEGKDFGRVYLLGARPEAVTGTADWMKKNYPNVQVVGARDGYFSPEENDQVLDDIRQSRADLLLIAMGVPMQEKWIAQHFEQTGVRAALGVGGLFDFYSGRIPRAPLWMRKLGFEWLYRLVQEPRRMAKRYLIGNVTFIWKILRYGPGAPRGKQTPRSWGGQKTT